MADTITLANAIDEDGEKKKERKYKNLQVCAQREGEMCDPGPADK